MAFSSIGGFISANDKTAGTSFVVTTNTANLTAGRLGIIVVGLDNTSTTDGNTSEVSSITDAAGNTWSKLREFCNGQGAAAGGITVAAFYSIATADLGNAANVTINLANSITAKGVTGWVFSMTGTGINIDAQSDLAADGAQAGSMSSSGLSSVERIYLRFSGEEVGSSTSWTVSSGFTIFDHSSSSTGGGGLRTNAAGKGEFKIATSAGETSNPTTSTDDWASCLLSISETGVPSGGPWPFFIDDLSGGLSTYGIGI